MYASAFSKGFELSTTISVRKFLGLDGWTEVDEEVGPRNRESHCWY